MYFFRYPLKSYLLTPIRHVTNRAEHDYNQWQKRTRASVESTFGILKQRWRYVFLKLILISSLIDFTTFSNIDLTIYFSQHHICLFFLYECRCVDGAGGYLHHNPTRCAHIIVACGCLHNIALLNGMPPPPDVDNDDFDAVRPPRQGHAQPHHVPVIGRQRHFHVQNRTEYINRHFAIH